MGVLLGARTPQALIAPFDSILAPILYTYFKYVVLFCNLSFSDEFDFSLSVSAEHFLIIYMLSVSIEDSIGYA